MPKQYSEKEKEIIKAELLHYAAECMGTYGIKKTTVDELVRLAKIPKGTFYLFYESKEMLLMEVVMQWHEKIEQAMIQKIIKKSGNVGVEELTEIFYQCILSVEETGLAKLIASGELEVLMRKMPETYVQGHMEHDEDMLLSLKKIVPNMRKMETGPYSAALRGVFGLLLYEREMGTHFHEAIRVMLRGIVMQLLT